MLMRENNNDLLAERFEVIEWLDIAPYKVKNFDKSFIYFIDYRRQRLMLFDGSSKSDKTSRQPLL